MVTPGPHYPGSPRPSQALQSASSPQPPSPTPVLLEAVESAVASATEGWTRWVPGDLARLVSRGWGAGVRSGQEAREERGPVRAGRAHLAPRHRLVSSTAPRPSSHLTSGTGADRSARRPRPPPWTRVRGCPRPPGCVRRGLG